MKVYQAKLKAGTDVNCFSIVLGAAVETKLSKFVDEVVKPVFFANQERRIIYSVAMRPNKQIFRKDINGEPAYITFDAQEVEKMQESYFKMNNQGLAKMSLNHSEESISEVYPMENWIVFNPELDKSKTLLMEDVQAGDLILGFKINNNDVWEKFIKTGEVDGISLEAFLDYEIINPTNINMNVEEKKTFITELKETFKSVFMAMPAEKTAEELAAEKLALDPTAGAGDPSLDPTAGAGDPLAELQTMYDAVVAENADLKEKLATMQAKHVEEATALQTLKSQKAKAENDLAVFKAEKLAIQNLPNEKSFAEMTSLEKYRQSKKNQ
jgi:hypothetical protein